MSRKVLQPFTIYVLFRISCEACHQVEASRSFNTPSYSGSALLETCLEYPFGHHDLYPETKAFGLPKIHSYESSQLIRILPKTGKCSGSLYGPSESLANDLDCIPHIPFYSMKSCINTRPSLLQISSSFHLYITLRPRILLNLTHSKSHHLNNTSTRSVSFITTIFRLDSFMLSWTKILS